MRYLLMALAAVSILFPPMTKSHASQEPEAIAFHISSLETAFAMQGEFEGQYRIYPDSIEVTVSRALIRISRNCPYKGRRLFSSIRFGLATCIDEKQWNTVSKSKGVPVEQVMSPGDEHDPGQLQFSIPKEGEIDLTKHWLVVQLDDLVLDLPSEKKRMGYAYAHSPRDIFSKR